MGFLTRIQVENFTFDVKRCHYGPRSGGDLNIANKKLFSHSAVKINATHVGEERKGKFNDKLFGLH